ncbi:MAG TPA: 8-amino-7-oxononanoate synthase [Vicinamibacterales bacterium]|nr:8-amino-7-oxononanoate synthase [Vicinamibacterales bacterium]
MTVRQDFEDGFRVTLNELRRAGLLRELRLPNGIDLVSNDYLGLAAHPHLTQAMRVALGELPAGSAGSRLLRGHHEIFERIEARLAAFSGTESALLFGSGYAANIGLLQALVSPDDLILSDERNHASLIDGIRLTKAATRVFGHQDLGALEEALRAPHRGRAIVVTESVFSMDGDCTPLEELCTVAERGGAAVIVDEAHATGLYGGRGSGRVEELGIRDRVLATIHTGGKALGSGGAWVAGSRALRDVLVNRARSFIFSTAPLPVVGAALEAGLQLTEREPGRRADVHRKSLLVRRALAEAGVNAAGQSQIVPILAGSNEAALALQSGLSAAGFDVRAIRPPSVAPGTARLRVTVRYPVPDEDLLRFAREVAHLLAALGVLGSDPRTVRGSDPNGRVSRIG